MKEKIKILWVNNALGCGGAERQMLYMYNILQAHSCFDITILYYAKGRDELNLDGIKTVFVDKSEVGSLATARAIRKYIKDNGIQIMHAFGGGTANVYGRLGAALTGAIPIGALLGKTTFKRKSDAIVNSILNLFGNWWTVNNIDLIPILTSSTLFTSKNKIKLLHNGFVPASAIDYKQNELTEFDVDKENNFVFTVTGRLHPVKNYGLYLRAAKNVIQKHDKVRFWVVGNGDEYENLTSLAKELGIEDKVRFWGYRTDVDVAMSRSDCFVQTSFTEGSPNTIAEAMRASKPIISTNSTDLSEMIEDDKNGYVVENDNCEALTRAMERVLHKSAEERRAMCARSSELFMENFLDVRVAAEFNEFYNKVITKSK